MADDSSDADRSLVATYETETHSYYPSLRGAGEAGDDDDDDGPLEVRIRSATTTVGRNLVSGSDSPPPSPGGERKDSTGLMIWPASHVLCQYLTYSILSSPPSPAVRRFSRITVVVKGESAFPPLGKRILELGCGSGIAGITAALALTRLGRREAERLRRAAEDLNFDELDLGDSDDDDGDSLGVYGGDTDDEDEGRSDDAVIVCTDADGEVLRLCRDNINLAMFLNDKGGGEGGGGDGEGDGGDGDGDGDGGDVNNEEYGLAAAAATDDEWSDDDDDADAFDRFGSGVRIIARPLRWGCDSQARAVMAEAAAVSTDLFARDLDEDLRASVVVAAAAAARGPGDARFDTVMAADVVYPATSGGALRGLFDTVDATLKEGGVFLLAFASRDGHRSPLRLLETAGGAGFRVNAVPGDAFLPGDRSKLPPLLDAKLLALRRAPDAAEYNALLGGEACEVFPGLRRAAERAAEGGGVEEEWEAPGGDE